MVTIPATDDGQRLDRWLRQQYPYLKYGDIQKACRTGQIRRNGQRVKGSEKLATADQLRLPPWMLSGGTGADRVGGGDSTHHMRHISLNQSEKLFIQNSVLYQDESLFILNKPAGVAAQAGGKVQRSMDRLLQAYLGATAKPRLCHRLDQATSGVMVFALDRAAAEAVTRQFKLRETVKVYHALVHGGLPKREGHIDFPLRRAVDRAVVDPAGDAALTHYQVLDAPYPGITYVAAQPQTGRMHQLRAHFAAVGTPVVGDMRYGGHWPAALTHTEQAIALHAYQLTLRHPQSGAMLTITAPLPNWAL